MDHDGRVELVESVASAGGERAVTSFRTPLDVETKGGPMDAVTAVDRAVQREAADRIAAAFPDDAFVGEEDDARETVPEAGYAWVVDPIDGTNNYVRENRRWATSVALARDAAALASVNDCPAMGDRYAAGPDGPVRRNGDPVAPSERTDPATFTVAPLLPGQHPDLGPLAATIAESFGDLRRVGSAQASLSMVAAGELDATVSTFAIAPWDALAGVHHVRRAGGTATDLAGDPWRPGATGLVASNGHAHGAVLEAVRSP
jgi:myo-inositol-1(or 4)-monophosphatase